AGGGDLGDQAGDLLHRGDDLFHVPAGVVHLARAGIDLGHRVGDQVLDLLGGGGRGPRAASTAAFSARMLVSKAMPSITPMMSAIFFDAAVMPFIVPTASLTTSPPLAAMPEACAASSFTFFAFWAFWPTVAVICCIDAEVSSSALACSSVLVERSELPCAISRDAVLTMSLVSL